MTKKLIRTLTVFMALLLLVSTAVVPNGFVVGAVGDQDADLLNTDSAYVLYKRESGLEPAKESVTVRGADFVPEKTTAPVRVESYAGRDNVLIWETEEDTVSYQFNIPSAGLYNVGITYFPIPDNGLNITFGLQVDGAVPYDTLQELELPRMWTNDDKIRTDAAGNQYAPKQIEISEYSVRNLYDPSGSIEEDLQFAFTQGVHTLTFTKESGPIAIAQIALTAPEVTESYADIRKAYQSAGYQEYTGDPVFIEGENASLKSTRSLVPKADNTSADIYPSSATKSLINYIGSTNWGSPNEELTWSFKAPASALYRIGFNYMQDQVIDGFSYRWLKIDGVTPFTEAKNVKFDYDTDWRYKTLGDGKTDYLIYLEKGDHTLTMSVTMGETAAYYSVMEDMVEKIGNMYLDIVTITGTSPDANRDYDLFKQIPNFIENLKNYSATLNALANAMKQISGKRGSQYIAALNNMSRVLDSMIENPYTAQVYVSDFYTNYTTLGAWLFEMKSMPVSLDCIQLSSPKKDADSRAAGFFESIAFGFKRFIVSFDEDYSRVADVSGDGPALKIWVNWGRDQAMVLNSLIQETFTPKTKINVNLELTNASLIKGILSDTQPDLSLHLSRTEPVNLAMRGALYDLSKFDDFDEVMKRFGESSGSPYIYNGGAYALPDTQSFYIMFYRTDVFEKFGLSVPETWDDFIKTTAAIQRNNLQVYLPYTQITSAATVNTGVGGLNLFASILMQNGGSFYNDKRNGTVMNTPTAFKAFTFWTDLYTKYRIPTQASFYNRFRAGTAPLGIDVYTSYTTLVEEAPEIAGKWAIALVPGVRREDGTVDHTVSGAGSGCSILKKSKYKDEAWEFLKWWTEGETQLQYNNNVESILGSISRITTANLEAFSRMSWSRKDLKVLLEQRKWIREVPEVPGSYYLARSVDQAFWAVYNEGLSTKDTLIKWDGIANDEIKRKIAEYSE